MPASKRQKVSGTTLRTPARSTRGIASFTKVSKATAVSKTVYNKVDCLDITVSAQSVEIEPAKKRKLLVVEEIEVDPATDQACAILSATINQSRDIRSFPQRRDSQRTPQTPNRAFPIEGTATPRQTLTKGARGLLDKFALSSSSPDNAPLPLGVFDSSNSTETSTPQCSPESIDQRANAYEQLPIELLDLINLHASFLTALTLHHAHNGTNTPADLRLLCPDVARAWGKRKVLLDDIRRTLGIVNASSTIASGLTLSDYGYGKICVESQSVSGIAGRIARPLDENLLNDEFKGELQTIWETRNMNDSIAIFISTLPLETITLCSSLSKMSPLLAKGQRRLEELRAGITLKKEADMEKSTSSSTKDEGGCKPTLLERLKAKQMLQSTLPAPPSKAELGRKAALHRLEEVVSVLSLLTTSTSVGQVRVSFTLPTVLGKLKDSFKTPMSREEGETCVKLLASDIAPEWLRVVKMGKVDAIIVNRDNRPSDMDIKERVKRAVR
jgi:hypothetical protein